MGFLRRISLTQWILISMVVGIAIGEFFPHFAVQLGPISGVFLRMIKSLVVPLIFGTLVVGIAGHGDDLKQVGKLALGSIIYFEIVTTIALAVGLATVNIVKPGVGVSLTGVQAEAAPAAKITFTGLLEHIVPSSVIDVAGKNEILSVVFWTIIFAVALVRVQGKPKATMLAFCDSLSEVMFKFVGVVMLFAPFGIGAAIAVTVGDKGLGVLANLGKLVLSLYGALIVFVFGVLLPIAFIFRIPIRRFLSAVKEPWLIAFSTASSEAALPRALQAMEEFGVPKRVVAFVLPTGYSFNLDGSTLYLALASVFVSQAAGIHMSLSQQLVMMLTLMVTSKGVAAVPRASLVILAGALTQFGLPLE
ncbi:MAG TPA: cation:dicarboxylase symporter family transporter, partial [Gemmatimonadaceae bacterium]|nr:cation:dicarboxylase symporter family transporter [Gemmatimonadaceae bacterium]